MASEKKGFYTSSDYWGWINGEFRRFPTESEYIQALEDLESENEPDVAYA